MQLEILRALLPADTVTALSPVAEHFAVLEYFVDGAEGSAAFFSFFLPLGPATLVAGLPAFLAGHKKVFSLRTVVL